MQASTPTALPEIVADDNKHQHPEKRHGGPALAARKNTFILKFAVGFVSLLVVGILFLVSPPKYQLEFQGTGKHHERQVS